MLIMTSYHSQLCGSFIDHKNPFELLMVITKADESFTTINYVTLGILNTFRLIIESFLHS